MTITRDQLEKRASSKGYTLHENVTDDRLAKINPRMLNGRPEKLTKKNARHIDATKEQIEAWIAAGCHVAAYDLGDVGSEVIAPPTAVDDLMLVMLPSFRVMAKCEGSGERTDGDGVKAVGLTYTILS